MNGAIRFGTNPPYLTFVDSLGDDNLGPKSARFELRPFCLLRGMRLLRLNLDVLVAGDDLAAVLRTAISGTDLHYLRPSCNLLLNVRLQLGPIAKGSVQAFTFPLTSAKGNLLCPVRLGAINAASSSGTS
jgi:hypothetical protein